MRVVRFQISDLRRPPKKRRRAGFNPEAVSLLHQVMEEAWAELSSNRVAGKEAERLRSQLAKPIIEAAAIGEVDPADIKAVGLKALITQVINEKLQHKV